jgi:hypothetical protein
MLWNRVARREGLLANKLHEDSPWTNRMNSGMSRSAASRRISAVTAAERDEVAELILPVSATTRNAWPPAIPLGNEGSDQIDPAFASDNTLGNGEGIKAVRAQIICTIL